MIHKPLISILLLTLFICTSLHASAIPQIRGKVIDRGTKIAVEFADVFLSKQGETAIIAHTYSDENGLFALSSVQDGSYILIVKFVGYDIYNSSDILLTSSSQTIDLGIIELQTLEKGLSEVVVEANKRQVIYKLDKKVIDATNNLMSSGGSAVDILENTPSIRVDADGEVTFRGSSGFVVYVDGKPSLYSGSQALQQVPAGHIENIEIITTPSARHDTGGDVGIINIITKKDSRQGVNGMVNLSGSTALSNSIDFMLTHQSKKLRWHLSGGWSQPIRKSHFDQNKTTIVDDVTTTSHSKGPRGGKNYHYNLKGGWTICLPNKPL